MARIAGVDIPNEKRLVISLTYIFGIGNATAAEITQRAGLDPNTRVKDLKEAEIALLRKLLTEEYKIEGELRTFNSMNVKRLVDIQCYRGLRHRRGLPVHGQRTHTNARTRKGKKKTMNLRRSKPTSPIGKK